MRYAYILIVAAALAACSSGGSEPTGTGTPSPSGERITLVVGESREIPGTGLTVEFLRVAEDSRCPIDVTCVWAGNALVQIGMAMGTGPTVPLELNTTLEPRAVDWNGVRVTLRGVMPEPRSTERIPPESYEVRLQLEDAP